MYSNFSNLEIYLIIKIINVSIKEVSIVVKINNFCYEYYYLGNI